MDLEVELDSSKSLGRSSVVRKLSATERASNMLPETSVSAQDLTPTVTGRKQSVTRRSSINSNPSSGKQSVEPSEADSDQSSQKRRRKSRQMSVESDSPMFAKPTSSTRTRHLVSRRYSPSPDTRPGAKLKNLVAKLQEKEKQGRIHDKEKQGKKKLEFALTKLPTDYDSISIILLGNLRFEPIDFQLPRGIEKRIREAAVVPQELPVVDPPSILQSPPSFQPPLVTATKAKTATASRLSAKARKEPVVKEEVLSVQSSDDEEDKEVVQPVVRMADIGAAPFTPAPVVTSTPAIVAKPRRKPKSSAPVIKLPRRKTIDIPIRMDMSEKSSTASVSSAEDAISAPLVPEKRRRRPSKRVENADASDTSLLTSSFFLSERPAAASKPTTEPKKGRRHTIVPIAVPVEIPMIDAGVPSESTSKDASVEKAPIESTSAAVSQPKGNTRAKGKRRRLSDPSVLESEPSKSTDVSRAIPSAKRPKRISTEETADLMAEVLERRKVLGKRSATKRVSLIETPSTSSTTSEYVPSSDSRGASPIRPVPQHTALVGKEDHSTIDTAKSARLPARIRTSTDGRKESIDEKPSLSVTPESNDSIKEPSDPSTSRSSTEVKVTRKHSSVTVKAAGAGKVRISSSVVESASVTSKSPSLLSVRRSSRSHTLTKKMLDSDIVLKTGLATPTISKPVDPNSALGILQRVSRFTRPIRSPSPQPMPTVLPHPSEPTKEIKTTAPLTAESAPEAEKPVEKDVQSADAVELSTEKGNASSSRDAKGSVDVIPLADSKPEVTEKKPEELASTTTVITVASVPLVPETQAAEPKEKTISPVQPSPKVSHTEEATTVTTGRSSRVVRPSSRFVNPDFVSPIRRRKSSSSTGPKVEPTAKRKDSKAAVTISLEEPVMSPVEKPEYTSPIAATHPPEEPAPTTSSEKTLKPTPVVTPVHTMETRRRSLKKTRPIKIKLRLGCFPRVIAVNTGSDVKADEPETSKPPAPAPVAIVKKPAKRYISPWSHYVPSVKPVLGNVYYSDGTVEKLGVSVNAVMDRLLLEVCKDGITRHSAIVNKREKRRRNIEKARERVARLKKEKEEREAQGWVMRQQKASHHIEPRRHEVMFFRAESPRHELGPRHRGGLLQKDFLYPSLKRGTKAEKKKKEELRKARSRRVMSQLAESTYDEAERPVMARRGSAPSKAVPAKIPRPREPSPFDPQKEERLRLEAEERERQKRLTMPISFNTFLSSKTSVLVAQPLLQPQRISDRAPVADHFYRELLCEYNSPAEAVEDTWNDFDMDVEDSLDVTTIEAVHIPKFDDYVAPPVLDESAEPVATQVEQLLLRPSLYAEEDGISYLYEKALEQPELRRTLLSMAIDCISALHVARLSACGREAAIVVYNTVTHQASKMRDVICMFSREREEAVFWMHRYLIEMLPVELLASYLFLLRHTRLLNCQVKSIVRSTQNESSPWPEVTKIIGKYVEENVVEPDAADLERTIAPASLSDVVFVLVAPNVTVGDFSVRDRFYDSVFKWLREIGHPSSTILKIKIDENYSTAVGEMVLTAVNMISRLVTKMVREHRQKRIVLVGWSTTCCFNHMVLSAVPGVSAIIDLAFPVLSLDGPRGEPDDDILLTYCPSLFVVGAQACDYHPAAMKMMRSSMIMPSGLVVIGHANNNLLVSCSTLSRLRITQKVVNRCIVEQICDFLGMEWTKRERSRLVPMPLNDIFKVDLTQLKLDEKAAQASKKPKDEGAVRKKKLSGTPLQSPIPRETSPSPLPISSLDSVRSNFQSLLKKAGIEKTTRPEERQLLSGSFKEPRLPVKPVSEMDSPVPRTDSPNLLDPASISLI
ncbi:unnamed protein product [Cylicocyclus nassatus]|uniref:KANSL3 helical domain-containing protein n=1 Tax=Cylicocyclus nassatus TaxID=53992 RepID=A0AA36DNK9_CYLNA|nr:unnamed protein product [Cylicocyclus nassatus]